ncbi:hypothetical protein IJ732_04380 [bacterium]|nr:hypothetical protein [bacterium]
MTCRQQDGKKLVSNNNTNFERALELSENHFSYTQLIDLLKSQSIVEKQFAILNLEELKSVSDGELLCSNLTGQDGKIREAVSFKLSELFQNETWARLLANDKNFEKMLDGLMDINGNVCRNILEIDNKEFLEYLAKNLIKRIKVILEDISKLKIDDKQYVISKRNFQLYWALEGLYKVLNLINPHTLKDILLTCAKIEDYTIKEKTAKIVSVLETKDFDEIKAILKQNANYYVERYLK